MNHGFDEDEDVADESHSYLYTAGHAMGGTVLQIRGRRRPTETEDWSREGLKEDEWFGQSLSYQGTALRSHFGSRLQL